MSKKSDNPVVTLGLTAFTTPDLSQEEVIEIDVNLINITPHQTRRFISINRLELMAKSIKEHGVITPILVSPKGDRFDLVYGQMRFRAAILAGKKTVKAVSKQISLEEQLEFALVENFHRTDLNPIDEVDGILSLFALKWKLDQATTEQVFRDLHYFSIGRFSSKEFHYDSISSTGATGRVEVDFEEALQKYQRIAKVDITTFVTHRMPLLKLPEPIIQAIREGNIAYSKARIISRVEDEDFRKQLLEDAIANKLTRKEISKRIKEYKASLVAEGEQKELTLGEQAKQVLSKIKKKNNKFSSEKQNRIQELLKELENVMNQEEEEPQSDEGEKNKEV